MRDRRGRAWLLLAIVLAVWGLTDVRNRGRVDPGDPLAHKSDFTVYTEAGAAFFDGRNPYDVSNPRGWRYLYPPLFAILVAPLAAIPPQWQAVVWYFISLGVAYCCWRESARLWRFLFPVDFADGAPPAPQTPPNWLGYLAAASLALPALNCLQRGQVGILIAYLLILGFRLIVETRSRFSAIAGGAALAAAIAIKLTPALVVGALLATLAVAAYAARWRGESAGRFVRASAGVALGLVLCIVILPTLAIGAEANIRHLETWLDRVVVHHDMGEDNNSGFYSVRNQSLTNAVERLGNWLAYALAGGPSDTPSDAAGRGALERIDQPGVQRALAPARWCLLVLLAVGCWKAGRRGDTLDWAAMFGLASTATLLVSPLSWAHHYLIWLPGVLFVPAWLWRGGRTRLATTMAVGACLLMIAHYSLLDWTGRAGLLGLGTTAWYLVAARLVARGESVAGRCTTPSAPRAEALRQAA